MLYPQYLIDDLKRRTKVAPIITALILLIILVIDGVAQDKPRAMQIDEFSNPNCEELSARLDYMAAQLAANPTANLFISVTGKNDELRNNLFEEGMIKTYFPIRKVDFSRWHLVRAGLDEQFIVRVWLIPPAGQPPEVSKKEWSYKLAEKTKPFIFHWGDSYATDVCPAVNGLGLLSDVLEANPTARTNVVLRVRGVREYNSRRGKTAKLLTRDYSIPKRQLRFFMIKRSPSDKYGIEPDAEYWLVP